MNKIKLIGVNETIYEETLDNGLKIFIYKTPGFEKKYACFETKYGSVNNEFVPIGENDMKKFPLGIAHFLEHKLFESSDDSNVFDKFESNGAYVNAATSFDKTYYYFSCSNYFEDNLKILIDFVQSPYLTDENVEKEKGIIGQEIDMCNDDPERFLIQKLYENAIKVSPYKFDIAGSKETVNSINKEELYECYNTFYHPSNMFLTIVGDIDIDKTIKLIKDNQMSKKYSKSKEIIQKEIIEPKEVNKDYEEFTHNIENKKIGYCYKILLDDMTAEEQLLFRNYTIFYLNTLFGATSGFQDKLINNNIVKSYFDYDFDFLNKILLIFFEGDVLDDDAFYNEISSKLKDKSSLKKEFELRKKNLLAGYIRGFESPEVISSSIRKNYSKYGKIINNAYDLFKNMTYDEYIKNINKLYFDSLSKVVLNKKK